MPDFDRHVRTARRPVVWSLLAAGLMSVLGCAQARYVSRTADEGVVAVASGSEKDRAKAIDLMQAHFPSGYEIVSEEEVVVGQVTETSRKTVREDDSNSGFAEKIVAAAAKYATNDDDGFAPNSRSATGVSFQFGVQPARRKEDVEETVSVRDRTEWRIRYRRTSSADAPITPASTAHLSPSTGDPASLLGSGIVQ